MTFNLLKLLLVEDNEDEAFLLLKEVSHHWPNVLHKRVESESELLTALSEEWDVVLSDYRLPKLNGMDVLLIVRRKQPDLPFILVSGRITDQAAVDIMEQGADDYIMKDNLHRLNPAIEKATARYYLRRSVNERDEKLRQQENRFESIIASAPDAIIIIDCQGRIILFNEYAEKLWGYSKEETVGRQMEMLVPEWYIEEHVRTRNKYFSDEEFRKLRKGPVERAGKTKSGEEFAAEVSTSYFETADGPLGIMGFRDIRERKLIEKELENTNQQLRELAANLQSIREEERSDIAREIHDELGQQLTALKYDFSNYNKTIFEDKAATEEKSRKILSSIDEIINNIRRISSNLHPSILDDFGLGDALDWYSREFEKRSGIFCNFVNEVGSQLFEKKISMAAFRIYQEALTNISRHAGATSIESFLRRKNGDIVLSITDNGKGLNMVDAKNKKSLGLVSMKERALSINGQLSIENNKGYTGTTVTLKVAMPKAFK